MATTGKAIKIEFGSIDGERKDITPFIDTAQIELSDTFEVYAIPHRQYTFEVTASGASENIDFGIFESSRVLSAEIKPEFWFLETVRFTGDVESSSNNLDTGDLKINMNINSGTWAAEVPSGKLAAFLRWVWRFDWFKWLSRSFR